MHLETKYHKHCVEHEKSSTKTQINPFEIGKLKMKWEEKQETKSTKSLKSVRMIEY